MSDVHAANHSALMMRGHPAPGREDVLQRVMLVLQGIRPKQSNGLTYCEASNLTDAGFTSVEMVKVMLGVEAAFDIMIPQDMITFENFASATAISAMISRLG